MRRPELPYGRCVFAVTILATASCAASPTAPATTTAAAPAGVVATRGDGAPLAWGSLIDAALDADIVLVGEVHGHPAGLAAAADLFVRLTKRARPTVSLEFFERDMQPGLDAYVGGRSDEPTFLDATDRTSDNYPPGHRAMVEAAKRNGLAVIAANAPRRYAKIARTAGYDALRALPADEQRYFVIPAELPGGGYRTAFEAAMGGPDAAHHGGDFFLAQALWDATMAESAVDALERSGPPVVAVAGRFHVDHDGGLVQMVRARRPSARLLTISVLDEAPGPIAPDDRGRADIVIFAGPAPAAPAPGT